MKEMIANWILAFILGFMVSYNYRAIKKTNARMSRMYRMIVEEYE